MTRGRDPTAIGRAESPISPAVPVRLPVAMMLATAMIVASLFVMTPSAVGQSGQAGEGAPVRVDEDTLDRFARAILAMRDLETEYLDSMYAAETVRERERIRSEWIDEANVVLEEHDLSVSEYDELIATAQADPDMASAVEQRLEELQ